MISMINIDVKSFFRAGSISVTPSGFNGCIVIDVIIIPSLRDFLFVHLDPASIRLRI